MNLEYAYTHTQTLGTTGFFSCEPAQEITWEVGLRLICQRPLDSFLRSHLLRRLSEATSARWLDLANECLEPQSGREGAALAFFLLDCADNSPECHLAIQGFLPAIRERAAPFLRNAPEPLDNTSQIRQWRDFFRANIHAHCDISTLDLPKKPLYGLEELESLIVAMTDERDFLIEEYGKIKAKAVEIPPIPAAQTWATALDALERAGLLAGPEMRHEASLSPIALLRNWHVSFGIENGPQPHRAQGIATAYGRGLSLADARASCVMEIVERASAYVDARLSASGGEIHNRREPIELTVASPTELIESGKPFYLPSYPPGCDLSLSGFYWLEATGIKGEKILVPAQAVFLFCNLPEASFFDNAGSNGLASGNTLAQAKVAALIEILERDAHATTPYRRADCFRLASREKRIQDLLDDYLFRGIHVQFQDITTEAGVPAYRCFVHGRDGLTRQATGAGLNGARAAISALTETPWPYCWANTSVAGPASLPARLPIRFLEDLPNFSFTAAEDNLRLLENTLARQGAAPLYVDITRRDLGLPVVRAFIPGLSANADFETSNPPSARLFARTFWLK